MILKTKLLTNLSIEKSSHRTLFQAFSIEKVCSLFTWVFHAYFLNEMKSLTTNLAFFFILTNKTRWWAFFANFLIFFCEVTKITNWFTLSLLLILIFTAFSSYYLCINEIVCTLDGFFNLGLSIFAKKSIIRRGQVEIIFTTNSFAGSFLKLKSVRTHDLFYGFSNTIWFIIRKFESILAFKTMRIVMTL